MVGLVKELDDPRERVLSAIEARHHDSVTDALTWISTYLQTEPPAEDYAGAVADGAPLYTRTRRPARRELGEEDPRVIHSDYVVAWCRANDYHLDRPTPTRSEIEAALEWMGCQRSTTFYPRRHATASPKRLSDGRWWRLDAERTYRLLWNVQVPVLTGYPGPARRDERVLGTRVRPGRSGDGTRGAVDADTVEHLVRRYLAERPPTTLLALAQEQGRPLCVRRPNRPPVADPFGAFRLSQVLVNSTLFSEYTSTLRGAGVAVRELSPDEVRTGFAMLAATGRAGFGRVTTVRAPDGGRLSTKGFGWVRVDLTSLIVPGVDFTQARWEYEQWCTFADYIQARHRRSPRPDDNFAAHLAAAQEANR